LSIAAYTRVGKRLPSIPAAGTPKVLV
jgi:hypothetical protein